MFKEMKIALYTAHEGLLRMLLDLWSEHEVRIWKKWEGYGRLKVPAIIGDEDIIVSTMPHSELNWLVTTKPIIAYITDPVYPTSRPGLDRWKKEKNFIAIGAENCYPKDIIVPVSSYIHYAMINYPIYNGQTNKVLDVNRKPDMRLKEITSCALGSGAHALDVATMMGDLPYTLANEPHPILFKQMYADYKVLFYFSNSPYTAVMYEAMKVGIPIVAYNYTLGNWISVIEQYFPKRSIYPEEIRKMLQKELDKPAEKVIYPFPSFEEIKTKWNNLFNEVLNA